MNITISIPSNKENKHYPKMSWLQTFHQLNQQMQQGVAPGCDLIGDIHGHADELVSLLIKMGYTQDEKKGFFKHDQGRIAIFVGDLIDRGPKIRETVHIVKSMVDNGQALCLMGNHEYNAIAFWHQPHVRSHNLKNIAQHAATILQYKDHEKEWESVLEWFRSLPIYLQLEDFTVVHALWDPQVKKLLKDEAKISGKVRDLQILTPEGAIMSHYWFGTPGYAKPIIEDILKGRDILLPEGVSLKDKDGNVRTRSRIKWWKQPTKKMSYADYVEDIEHGSNIEGLDKILLPKSLIEQKNLGHGPKEKPVFFGHYWLRLTDGKPRLQAHNICCLDYSVAKGGHLVAYRWNHQKGEPLSVENFVINPQKNVQAEKGDAIKF